MAIQKLNFIDSYDFSNMGFRIISKIINFISYLFNLPIRFYTVLSLWSINTALTEQRSIVWIRMNTTIGKIYTS